LKDANCVATNNDVSKNMKERKTIRSDGSGEPENYRKEVIDNMNQSKVIRSLIGMALMTMSVFIMTLIVHAPAQGMATNCSIVSSGDDTDCDGFLNTEEQTGITLADLSPFHGSNSGDPRPSRLDAPTPDVFVVVAPLASSLFPADLLSLLTSAASEMGVTVHQLTGAQIAANRNVTPRQRAIKIVESSLVGSNFGLTVNPGWGATNLPDATKAVTSTVYSSKILNWVQTNCPSGCSVYDHSGVTLSQTDLANAIMRHVAAHEPGHQMKLRGHYDATYGYHYIPCANNQAWTCNPTIMQQTIYKDSNNVVWYGKHYQVNANYGTPAAVVSGGYTSATEDSDSVTFLKKYCYYSGQSKPQTKTECNANTDCTAFTGGTCIYP